MGQRGSLRVLGAGEAEQAAWLGPPAGRRPADTGASPRPLGLPPAGIPTDHVLPDDPTCAPLIREYADDQARFFADFAEAYVKMTGLGARWA